MEVNTLVLADSGEGEKALIGNKTPKYLIHFKFF